MLNIVSNVVFVGVEIIMYISLLDKKNDFEYYNNICIV